MALCPAPRACCPDRGGERGGALTTSLTYTYNNDFAPATISYAGATMGFGYDADGLLTSADGYTIARDPQNGLALAVSGNGMLLERTWSGYGELEGERWSVGGQVPYRWTVARDAGGRITHREERIDGETIAWDYGYDDLGRLTDVMKNGVQVERYGYDANGNRIAGESTLLGTGERAYGYSVEDHLLTAGSDSWQFDVDGFLQSRITGVGTSSYSYTSRGELQTAWLPDGRILSYEHDPLGRRIVKKIDGAVVEKYLWEGMTKLLAVYDGNDALKERFVYADGRVPVAMTAGGITYALAYDQVGSLRAVIDAGGTVVKRIEYDSFGSIVTDSNPGFGIPLGFAGGLHDRDAELVRFGYRDYAPEVGRFTAKDPIDFNGGDTNLYAYTMNDPVNLVDPSGLWAGDVHSGVGRTDYGTFTWARQMGLSPSASTVMALANDATDAHGNWAPVAGVPGRHFDTALGGVDSRSLFADKELAQAISEYNAGNPCQAYKTLGRGLHSVQDIIAHMGWVPVLVHPSWYDNASFRTGALQATESASKAYLMRFLSATGQ